MNLVGGHVLLFVAVTVGSAIPFLPTGEMVSGAAALAHGSRADVLVIFLIAWIASVLGDTVLLLEARLGARRLRGWIDRRAFAARVHQAERKLHLNAFSAVVTGRLVPGGRAPVIIALGLGRYPLRRFVAYDVVACAVWAAVYAGLGSLGGRIADHPVWGAAIAVVFAVLLGALVQQGTRFSRWRQTRRLARLGRERRTADGPRNAAPAHGSAQTR
ncbi:DedA family protein [Xylanimonas protaetiae]|uniref:DedA family protein n=1 Tax=Xylanimonas protaetiae TaxID=2509457 RepID=UPI0013ECF6EA|nr:VTT domain-containing protein [Xylanimonas protaetiae]